jgi:hypothetical protein
MRKEPMSHVPEAGKADIEIEIMETCRDSERAARRAHKRRLLAFLPRQRGHFDRIEDHWGGLPCLHVQIILAGI